MVRKGNGLKYILGFCAHIAKIRPEMQVISTIIMLDTTPKTADRMTTKMKNFNFFLLSILKMTKKYSKK